MKGETVNLVENNKLGFVSAPNNIKDIREGFEKFMIASKEDMKNFENNAKQLLKNNFDKDKIIQKMTEEIFC
jgi:hypothetical protein